MPPTQTSLKGVIHGKTIELEMESGLPDGRPVDVTVRPHVETGPRLPPGEGIRRSAGAWADDPECLDDFLKQLRQDREQDRTPIEPQFG
jgi:hypothetical protein